MGDGEEFDPAVAAAVEAAVEVYVEARTDFLLASPDLPALLSALPDDVPVLSRHALADVTADVLVIAQEGDPLHPASVARELVGVLPRARLVVLERPGLLFLERARLRTLIAGHLSVD